MIDEYVNESEIRTSDSLIMKPIVIFQEQGVKAFELIMNIGAKEFEVTDDVTQWQTHGTWMHHISIIRRGNCER